MTDLITDIGRDLEHAQRMLAHAANHIDNRLGNIPTHSTTCRRPHCRRPTPIGYRHCWPCTEYLDGTRTTDPTTTPIRALWNQIKNRITP